MEITNLYDKNTIHLQPNSSILATSFVILKLCSLLTEEICVFHTVLTITATVPPTPVVPNLWYAYPWGYVADRLGSTRK
jgi:hypothetical protein